MPAPSVPKEALETISLEAEDGSIRGNFIRLGGCITDLFVKDKNGEWLDVVTGFDDRSKYLEEPPSYFGAVIGRFGNRIKNCQFKVPSTGKTHTVSQNHGKHSLHGGFVGYDRKVWAVTKQSKSSITLELEDPDGTEGYPGNVKATVIYTLGNNAKWQISMRATSDQETPINMTQHNFFNLDGYKEEDMAHYQFGMLADRIVAVDSDLIPTGDLDDVKGTPFDFQQVTELGPSIEKTGGLDHCFVYSKDATSKAKMSLWSPKSGIRMEVHSDQVAAQVYTAIGFNGSVPRKASQGGPGQKYGKMSAIALEQQNLIDAVNQPGWEAKPFLKPGEEYKWEATYAFGVADKA